MLSPRQNCDAEKCFRLVSQTSSDNDTAFVGNTMRIALKMLIIKQKLGCVYHPQLQGMVERANGMLKAKLAKIGADSQTELGRCFDTCFDVYEITS